MDHQRSRFVGKRARDETVVTILPVQTARLHVDIPLLPIDNAPATYTSEGAAGVHQGVTQQQVVAQRQWHHGVVQAHAVDTSP